MSRGELKPDLLRAKSSRGAGALPVTERNDVAVPISQSTIVVHGIGFLSRVPDQDAVVSCPRTDRIDGSC